MEKNALISILERKDLIDRESVEFSPLEGGVSSDIYLVADVRNTYVVKQALPKLQVEDDWYADVSRNETEQHFIDYLNSFVPKAVPRIVYSDADNRFFVMEYLDDSFENWKKQLLRGKFEMAAAEGAAELLAKIHLHSWHNEEARQSFNTTPNFRSLRIEPYLITTGDRHPELKNLFYDEAERLQDHREALVHGDFSPKNIMIRPGRLVILDHEVAWYGDPAFDVAFLLNHLYLKMLVHNRRQNSIQDLTGVVWDCYFKKMGNEKLQQMETRTGRLLAMLMLARVDGKSPVEYLEESEKEFIRTFVYEILSSQMFKQVDINESWKSKLKALHN